jgi:hypothetical protein
MIISAIIVNTTCPWDAEQDAEKRAILMFAYWLFAL